MSQSFTFYDASIKVAQESLHSLKAILQKGEKEGDSSKLVEARVHADMFPLSFQVHVATDIAQKMACRLTGKEPSSLDKDGIKTFADMYKRIDEVQQVLAKADKATVNEYAAKQVKMGMGPGKEIDIAGMYYNSGYAVPNIYFHVTAAYCILRKEGVSLGKLDYLKPYLVDHVPASTFQ